MHSSHSWFDMAINAEILCIQIILNKTGIVLVLEFSNSTFQSGTMKELVYFTVLNGMQWFAFWLIDWLILNLTDFIFLIHLRQNYIT